MPQSLSKVYLHIVFSTKNRKPDIKKEFRSIVQSYIVTVGSSIGSYTEEIFVNPDPIHWLCTLPRTITIADLVKKIKTSSSGKVTSIIGKNFNWQKGYGAFSVSKSKLGIVKKYIQNQEEHHREITFQQEYLRFLEEYKLEYDLNYVWD